MVDHNIQFTATINELGITADDLRIPESTYNRIKANDPNPFWVALEVGRVGKSSGGLKVAGRMKATIKRWSKVAIQELASVLSGGKVFTDKHGDPNDKSRSVFGEVVHGYNEVVDGRMRAVSVAYIRDQNTRDRIKKGELNVCSIEAVVSVLETATEFVVERVKKVAGLVIANGGKEKAGFQSAGILMSVQELEGEGEGEIMIKKSDVKAWIEDNNASLRDVFSSDAIANDPTVTGIVKSAMDESDANAEKELAKIKKELEKSNGELAPFKAEVANKRTKDMISENAEIKKLTQTQGTVAVDLIVKSMGDTSAMSDAEIATKLTAEVESTIGIVKSLSGGKVEEKKGVAGDTGGTGENNPYASDAGAE